MESAGEVSEKGVVRQRHPPPLFERQVRARIHRVVFPRRLRVDSRGAFRRAERHDRHGLQCDLQPRDVQDAAEPAGRRRPAVDLVGQLLPQRAPGRGREVLRRHGRRRCGQSRAGLLRPELAAGEGGEDGPHLRAGLEGGRHVFAGHREDRLLARKGAGRGQRAAEEQHRGARQLLQNGRSERVRPLQHRLGERHRVERRFHQRLHRGLRRSAGPQGGVGRQRQLHGQGGLPPHGGHLRERPVVRGPLARGRGLPQAGREGRFGQGHHRGDAGRRLLSLDAHRHQPPQRRLDSQGVRFEVGHHRQHHLCL